jgi:hypothetical protein
MRAVVACVMLCLALLPTAHTTAVEIQTWLQACGIEDAQRIVAALEQHHITSLGVLLRECSAFDWSTLVAVILGLRVLAASPTNMTL